MEGAARGQDLRPPEGLAPQPLQSASGDGADVVGIKATHRLLGAVGEPGDPPPGRVAPEAADEVAFVCREAGKLGFHARALRWEGENCTSLKWGPVSENSTDCASHT